MTLPLLSTEGEILLVLVYGQGIITLAGIDGDLVVAGSYGIGHRIVHYSRHTFLWYRRQCFPLESWYYYPCRHIAQWWPILRLLESALYYLPSPPTCMIV